MWVIYMKVKIIPAKMEDKNVALRHFNYTRVEQARFPKKKKSSFFSLCFFHTSAENLFKFANYFSFSLNPFFFPRGDSFLNAFLAKGKPALCISDRKIPQRQECHKWKPILQKTHTHHIHTEIYICIFHNSALCSLSFPW